MKKFCFLMIIIVAILGGCSSNSVVDNNNRGPILIRSQKPVYPKALMRTGAEGDVWVKMWIDTLGRVRKAMIEKTPDQALCNAAFDVAFSSRFKPAMLDGKPINVWFIAPIPMYKKAKK